MSDLAVVSEIQIFIDDDPFFDFVSFTVNNTLNALSDATLVIDNTKGRNSVRLIGGETVKIYAGWEPGTPQKIFEGIISTIEIPIDSGGSFLSVPLEGIGEVWEKELTVDDLMVPYSQQIGTIQTIIEYINTQTSRPASLLSSASGIDISITYDFTDRDASLDIIQKLASIGGYEWFYSFLVGTMLLREPLELIETNVTKSLILGSKKYYNYLPSENYAQMISDKVTLDISSIINRIKYTSSGLTDVVSYSQNSHDVYGFWREKTINDDTIQSQSGLQLAADSFIDIFAVPLYNVELQTWGMNDVEVGSIVYIDDRLYGTQRLPSRIYRVVSMTHEYSSSGWFCDLVLGEERYNLVSVLNS